MICMEGRPAVPATSCIRAITGFMSRVLAVASETVDVGRVCVLAFPKRTARWSPWVHYLLSLKTVFSFTVFWVAVSGSLCCMNARNNTAR